MACLVIDASKNPYLLAMRGDVHNQTIIWNDYNNKRYCKWIESGVLPTLLSISFFTDFLPAFKMFSLFSYDFSVEKKTDRLQEKFWSGKYTRFKHFHSYEKRSLGSVQHSKIKTLFQWTFFFHSVQLTVCSCWQFKRFDAMINSRMFVYLNRILSLITFKSLTF